MMTFNLKRPWYRDIASGVKTVEYRSVVPYWTSRITKIVNPGSEILFRLGYYDRSTDLIAVVDRIDVGPCPYKGWTGDFYRIHFHLKGGTK